MSYVLRCLQVSEVFLVVCKFARKRDLLRLALTCRTLCPDALDVLWADTGLGIVPLLYCLPEDAVQMQMNWQGPLIVLSIIRIPHPHEWDRIRRYASRMKTLDVWEIYGNNWYKPTQDCYSLFLDHWPYPECVFPNLCTASLEFPSTTGLSFLTTLTRLHRPRRLKLTLCPLKLHEQQPGVCLDVFSNSLKSFGAQLRHSRDPRTFTYSANYVSNALCACTALDEVDLSGPISSRTLAHLARLPGLTSLAFTFTRLYLNPQLLAPHPENFRHLRTLALRVDRTVGGPDQVCELLANLHPVALETLTIDFDREPPTAYAPSLIRLLARFKTLRTLKLTGRAAAEIVPWSPSGWNIKCSPMFSALSPLVGLRTLELRNLPLQVTADDIKDIPRFWPDLEMLRLSATDEYTTTSVCATDLHVLAAGSAKLRQVWLAIRGGGTLPDGEDSDRAAVCHSRVEFLGLCPRGGRQRDLDPGHMDVLRRMFPNAKVALLGLTKRPIEGRAWCPGLDGSDIEESEYVSSSDEDPGEWYRPEGEDGDKEDVKTNEEEEGGDDADGGDEWYEPYSDDEEDWYTDRDEYAAWPPSCRPYW